ncbi:SGNH/GDSL hydrolase family protein [Virgibacillus sp. DJP39]|uniref:SGNH/GDSL hydrolase family protein n=1 Tax=Virgibacillus sp. DJP39 TaxID=3409790 RepID=UPI003BB625D8
MKKKIVITVIGVFIIGLTIFLVLSNTNSTIEKAIDDAKIEDKKEKPDKKIEKSEPNQKKEIEPEDNVANKVKDLVTGAVQETVQFFTETEAHVVAIGDSLTEGIGDETGTGGYVGMLNNALNSTDENAVEFTKYGKRGRRSDQLLEKLKDPEVKASISDADIVLITIGANDIMKVMKENFTNITSDDFSKARISYEDRLKKIFEKIYSINPRAEVYLLGFYDPFGRYFPQVKELGVIVENWNATGKKITEQYNNATFVPTIDLFDDRNVDLFWKDNFHPNYRGYHRIAERVLEYLHEE